MQPQVDQVHSEDARNFDYKSNVSDLGLFNALFMFSLVHKARQEFAKMHKLYHFWE